MNSLAITRARRGRRVLLGAAAVVISGLVTAGWVQPASAATTVSPFDSVDSTPVGCRGASIDSISSSTGVKYYYHGHRLHLPSKVLPFDKLGIIELTAKPKPGYTLTQNHGQVLAPTSCFTAITPSSEARLGATQSWCKGASDPFLEQVFSSDSFDTVTAAWKVVRTSNHKVVARGTASITLGIGPVDFPLPAGLPLGKYVLTVRNTASSRDLFPYSMPAEQYRCMKPATVSDGAITFRVPAGGPDAKIDIYDGEPQAPTSSVTVRAGHRYTYTPEYAYVNYVAYPTGNHVGVLGYGSLEVPQS